MTPTPRPFPHWILAGGLLVALGFLPTLTAPFDFADDGDLVYPAPAGSDYVARWWDRVRANVDHLGPFRPTLWVHWEVQANTLNANPVAWRAVRLLWCGLAAAAFLWLLRELGVPPPAALLATAAAFWNPYRNEVWVSLTLAEGVAMPYLFAALAAARRANRRRQCWWDAVAVGGFLVALGCKNTFAAVVPALLVLRRPSWPVAGVYLLPLLMPAAHFVYFKLNWHPGQYVTPGPSLGQLGRELNWLKGAAGLDFLGAGIALALFALWRERATPQSPPVATGGLDAPSLVWTALALIAGGLAAYLPLDIMAARYTIPAVWGCDLLLALLLAKLLALPTRWPRQTALVALGVGLAALTVANLSRQERVAARNRLLWHAVHHLEQSPPNTRVEWVADGLGPEEGIHVAWHLRHRGRPDIAVGLVDADGRPVERVELPPLAGRPTARVTAGPPLPGWRPAAEYTVGYRFGYKQYTLRVDEPAPPPTLLIGPEADAALRAALRGEGKP